MATETKSDAVRMIGPDGKVRLIPPERVAEALLHEMQPVLRMESPEGTQHWVPVSKAIEAQKNNMRMVQMDGKEYAPGTEPVIVGENSKGQPIWGTGPKYLGRDAQGKPQYEAQPEKPGFLSSAADAVVSAGKGIVGMFDPRANEFEKEHPAFNTPLAAAGGPLTRMLEGQLSQEQQAEQEAKQADAGGPDKLSHELEAGKHVVASAVPFVGPWIAGVHDQLEQDAATGNYRAAAGTVAGNLAVAAAPEALGKGARGLREVMKGRMAEFQAPAAKLDEPIAPGELSPRERYHAAQEMGVNLDRAQATAAPIPKMAKRVTEQSLVGNPKFEANNAANVEALHAHAAGLLQGAHPDVVGRAEFGDAVQTKLKAHKAQLADEPGQRAAAQKLLDSLHPQEMSREQFGNAVQDAMSEHRKVLDDKTTALYDKLDQRLGDKMPSMQDIRGVAKGIYSANKRFYDDHPEMLDSGGRRAWAIIKDFARDPKDTPITTWADLQRARSHLLDLTRTGALKEDLPIGWVKQVTGAIDSTMTSGERTKGLTAADMRDFRTANETYKELKTTYDNTQSPFYWIARDGGIKAADRVNGLEPSAVRQFKSMMDAANRPDIAQQMQRQYVSRLLDPPGNGTVDLEGLPARWAKAPKEMVAAILDPTGSAAAAAKKLPSTLTETPPAAPAAPAGSTKTTLLTPNQEYPANYRLVEASSLTPSHNAHTFEPNLNYPAGVQERAYDKSREAQMRVTQQAQNFNPQYVVNDNPDAVNGPPVITPDGTVLGGNSRAMSLQRLYKSGDPAQYRAALESKAGTFGLDPASIAGMKEPVLVREVAKPATLDETRRLASDLNKSMTGAMGVSEKAVSAGKNLRPKTLSRVADMLGEGDSLRDLMSRKGSDLVKLLSADGLITSRERPQYVDAKTGGLSEEGKTFVERALMGSVLDDPRLMDSAPKSILNKLERSIGTIQSFASRADEWNLLPALRQAIAEHAAIADSGSTVDTHLAQQSLFGDERNPVVDQLVRVLAGKPNEVSAALATYAKDADSNLPGQARMFGEASAHDAFNHAFGGTLSEEDFHNGFDSATTTDPSHPTTETVAPHDQGVSGRPPAQPASGGSGSPSGSGPAAAPASPAELKTGSPVQTSDGRTGTVQAVNAPRGFPPRFRVQLADGSVIDGARPSDLKPAPPTSGLGSDTMLALGDLADKAGRSTLYDKPGSQLKQIVSAPDGSTAAQKMFSDSGKLLLTPEELKTIDQVDPGLTAQLRRQAVSRLFDPSGNDQVDLRNFASRWSRAQKAPLEGLLTPDQIESLDNLASVSRTVNLPSNPSGTAVVLQPAEEAGRVGRGMLEAGGKTAEAALGAGTGAAVAGPLGAAVGAVGLPLADTAARGAIASRLLNPEATKAVMEHTAPGPILPAAGHALADTAKETAANIATSALKAAPAGAQEGLDDKREVKPAMDTTPLPQPGGARPVLAEGANDVVLGNPSSTPGAGTDPKEMHIAAPQGATHEVIHPDGKTVLGHMVDGEYVPLEDQTSPT